jgi:hypothetical protein
MNTKLNEEFDIEDKFNPDAYRQSLKERLGIANLPTTKLKDLNKIDVPDPAIHKATEEIRTPELIPAAPMEDAPAPKAVVAPGASVGNATGAEAEVNDPHMGTAQAMVDDVLNIIDKHREQATKSGDRAVDMMWRKLHIYIYENRDKIAKTMAKGAE